MNRKQTSVPVVIPPALDTEESELAARNEFLAEKDLLEADRFEDISKADEFNDEIILDENDAAPGGSVEEREAKNLRRAKRRKGMLFLLIFGAAFGIFVVFVSWAFGFGFFAPASRVSVDRNQKTNGINTTSATTTGDEKLKTALALVAGENAANKDAPFVSDNSTNPNAASENDLKLTTDGQTSGQSNNQPTGNMIVLPNENERLQSSSSPNQIRAVQPSQGIVNTTPNLLTSNVTDANSIIQPRANNNGGSVSNNTDGGIIGRSVFFGRVIDKNPSPTNANASVRNSISSSESINAPPFGTLLPVRLLGAIYTLRGAGGLVRMELTRGIKKGEFSYPAGTVIVGRLRGSEYNRAFISAFGAIDPQSGKLVKFEGEVLGIDGASGVKGERKSIKSWGARFLGALRETGGQVASVLAARGGGRGGTIVLSGTTGLGGEVSSIVRGDTQENSFVVLKAGIEAYVLITDLPGEQRGDDASEDERLADNKLPGINLSETEMAEILSTDDPNKIRAALLKMSPQFRALAIKAMEEDK